MSDSAAPAVKGKLPAFQFYPGDWLKDPELRSVSAAARGLYIDIICVLFESKTKYKLDIPSQMNEATVVSRRTGVPKKQVERLLKELEIAGVLVRDEKGVIYSKRMKRDEELRKIRREAGKLGGNPNLLNQNPSSEPSKS